MHFVVKKLSYVDVERYFLNKVWTDVLYLILVFLISKLKNKKKVIIIWMDDELK